ncbi:hypothetical protein [Brevibacterium album]|uniref:hypothetical protein n=1 Tax=Brevibacterium album TaxID=417948 RepID=UPI0004254BEA|nr:hypothetical protein [Brevibacterium album]
MVNEQYKAIASDRSAAGSDRRPPGLIASVVFGVGLLTLLIWQFSGVADDGLQFQVLNPDLHLIWKTVIVAAVGISTACSLLVSARRRWTMPSAIVNTAANWMGAAAIIALTAEGELFAPTLPTQAGTIFETTTDWSGLTEPFLLLVVAIAIWDSVDGILRARRSRTDRGIPLTLGRGQGSR